MSIRAKYAQRAFVAAITLATAGCASEEQIGSSTQDVTALSASLAAAYNVSDFNNLWKLEGTVDFFEGNATLVLVNHSQPTKPLVRANVTGGGMGPAHFSADAWFGELDSPDLPAVGDCIAVTSASGGRELTDEELRQKAELGAFVYISDPLSGAPKRPAWGVGDADRPKVYETVQQCLSDIDRSWSNASPDDKLTSVVSVSDLGRTLELKGSIGGFEGQSEIALVNVSHVAESLVLEKGFQSNGGVEMVGTIDVTVDLPQGVNPGDCIAVKNTSGGRGFSLYEKRAKDEFGAFLYAFTSGDGKEQPDGVAGPKVFRTSAECLKDPAANRAQ